MMHEPKGIAIVGMACAFPGAPSLDAYRSNIERGFDAITQVPPKRWDPVFYDPTSSQADRFYCRRGGFLGSEFIFDPVPYGIMPIAAEGAEPDQMIALDLVRQALKDAAIDDTRALDGERVSVILGRGGYMTARLARGTQHWRTAQQLVQALEDLIPGISKEQLASVKKHFVSQLGHYDGDTAIGLVPNLAASRIANRFDFKGAAYTIDAACASSLIAVDQAARELESQRADLVIAGGMQIADDLTFWSVFSKLGAISRSGQIRPLDRNADGLLIGEGVGILVLKRVQDALRGGDRIYAVIRGIGIASDGREKTLMEPRPEGQLIALERAWKTADLDPTTIGLLEAHGTGTPAGDRAELTTLARFFGRRQQGRAGIGSVKSMIGHAMPAAGAAGLIKAALAIYHGYRPPTLHCDEPHELMAATGFDPITTLESWEPVGTPRRAGLNAFGFGGINAHLVLEQGAGGSAEPLARPALAVDMLFVAADDPAALLATLETGQGGNPNGRCRLVIEDPTPERRAQAKTLVARGQRWPGRKGIWYAPEGLAHQGGKIAFLFPGVDGRFDPRVEDIARYFALPLPAHYDAREDDLLHVGAGIFGVGLMLNAVLNDLGIKPQAMAGHSIGEWTGMVASGLLRSEEAKRFLDEIVPSVSLNVPGVVFAALGCGLEQAEQAIAGLPDIALSHDNCPHQTILCGIEPSVDAALQRLRPKGVLTEKLSFRSGFHSPLLKPYVEPFRQNLDRFTMQVPEIPLWSATTIAPYPAAPQAIRDLFIRHLLEPVRFRELTQRLYDEGYRVFIQVGTGRLPGFVEDSLRGRAHAAIGANLPNRSGLDQLRRLAAELWCEGYPVRMERLGLSPDRRAPAPKETTAPRGIPLELSTPLVRFHQPLALPSIVGTGQPAPIAVDTSSPVLAELAKLQEELAVCSGEVINAWKQARATPVAAAPAARAAAPQARPSRPSGPRRLARKVHYSLAAMPQLIDHCFMRQPEGWSRLADLFPVVPMTLSLDMAMEAARELVPEMVPVGLEKIRANRWIEIEPPQDIDITAEFGGDHRVSVAVGTYFTATVIMAETYPSPAPMPQPLTTGPADAQCVTAEALYRDRWMFHGPGFQGVTEMGPMGRDGMHGVIKRLPTRGALLDAAGQLAGYWCSAHATENGEALPFRVDRVSFYGPHPEPGAVLQCDIKVLEFTEQWGRFDIEIHRDGRVWARIGGWEDRRFEVSSRMRKVLQFPETTSYCQQETGGCWVAKETWRSSASRYMIARRYLDADDLARYQAKNPMAQRTWLLGRIAAKDAVRQWLWDRGYGEIFPIEIKVANQDTGRPSVSGPFTEDLRISVSHSVGIGVALVAEDRDQGVDVEKIQPRDESLLRTALTDAELALLPAHDRDEWITRLWVAKEAVGKYRGTGLGGKPRSIELQRIDVERLLVDGVWVQTRIDGDHAIGWVVEQT